MSSEIRIGYVSAYDPATHTASVYYPDRQEQTTQPLPILTPFGLKYPLEKDDSVLVAHFSNGTSNGVILGTFEIPVVDQAVDVSGDVTMKSETKGKITLSQPVEIKKQVLGLGKDD